MWIEWPAIGKPSSRPDAGFAVGVAQQPTRSYSVRLTLSPSRVRASPNSIPAVQARRILPSCRGLLSSPLSRFGGAKRSQPWLIERSRLFSAMDTLDGDKKHGVSLIK